MIEYKGVEWYYYQGALLPRVPPHTDIVLTKKEEKELLKLSGAFFLRYTNEWHRNGGAFWYVVKEGKECLSEYKSKIRNQIKKGLKHCLVKKVEKEVIAHHGYTVYCEAFKSYTTFHKPVSWDKFQSNILNSTDDFWAVYNSENKLIAYANNFMEEGMCHYNSMKFHPQFLHLYPSYALVHTMNTYYLNEKKYLYVNDGARSIAHSTNIQNFLIQKFSFKKIYCKLNIAYRPYIKIAVNSLYPFRHIIRKRNNKIFEKIYILLRQEEIRRSYEIK